MYRWYQCASICYAYLCDCQWDPESNAPPEDADVNDMSLLCQRYHDSIYAMEILRTPHEVAAIRNCIRGCRWFSRGWTLQELIAPRTVYFFDRDWRWISDRDPIRHILEGITGIHGSVLYFDHLGTLSLSDYSIA